MVELEVDYPREVVAFMEPRAALASSTRRAGATRSAPGRSRRISCAPCWRASCVGEERIRVIIPEVGGGFGARNGLYPEFVLALLAARSLAGRSSGRACAARASWPTSRRAASACARRSGSMRRAASPRSASARAGATGGYLSGRSVLVVVSWMAPMICGPYRIPLHHFALEGVFTNTTPIAAYRGIARAELTYLLERLVDAAARQTGIDRIELRRRNLIAPDEMPWRSPTGAVYPPADFVLNLELGLEAIDWAGFPGRREASRERGRLRGIGVAVYVENAGGAPSEFADVRLDGGGEVVMHVGTQDFGMGHATVFAQVAADVLGIAPAAVRVVDGDTDLVAVGFGAHGSRCARIGGGAVVQGARAMVEQGRELAAELLEAAAADVEFADGSYRIRGTDRRIGLFEVAAAAEQRGRPLAAAETFETKAPSFPSGCQLCEVEVDPATGSVEILRHVMVADPGRVLNPLIVEGQLHGGIAQGIGQALLERVVWDEASGQLLSGSFMDFALPRADDLPAIEVGFHPVPATSNPLGIEGCGEAGVTGALPAVMNAVLDALAARGVRHLDMPATPEQIWRALQTVGSG